MEPTEIRFIRKAYYRERRGGLYSNQPCESPLKIPRRLVQLLAIW